MRYFIVEYQVYRNVGGNFKVNARSLLEAATKAAKYVEVCGLGHPEHLRSIEEVKS